MKAASIELLVLDVDGVLTEGRVSAAADGRLTKSFHVHDGCAIKLWQRCGGEVALLSGRGDETVRQRAAELGIERVHTGVADKLAVFDTIVSSARCGTAAVAYIGDDLPDLRPMGRSSFPVAVADAVPAVKRAAAYVTRRRGGAGAVAEVVELLLRKRKQWTETLLEEA